MLAVVRNVLARRFQVSLPVAVATVVFQLLLVAACALILQQNQQLRDQSAAHLALAAPVVGRSVPSLVGNDWTGKARTVEFGKDRRPTLIYAFAQDCAACIVNWPAIQLLQEKSPSGLRIVYLNFADTLTTDYLRQHAIPEDAVLSAIDDDSALHFEVRATPQAQLVSSDGIVVWSKLGKFDETDVARLLAAVETEMLR